ncbi:DUF2493 domain-containing protein [Aquimarina algiphila]|uniref:DUF2493 domain-containing protein n=1 Tax=Aquimarina algiphila TaxID=2047982 RepID=A0A554VRM5_9FLAO|nr:DUF2493 domain-containing protein [Aquimarina algiphila]TSE11313.1 DUF2493 domain-containing protein [Aquimarina algiphila]
MKVIIAGGRDFDDYQFLKKKCDEILKKLTKIKIVTGKQKSYDKKTKHYYGADYYGEKYAEEKGHIIVEFPADWDNLGLAAGAIRNKQMAQYADALIAFWDGQSKGTKNMIDQAKKLNLKTRVITYTKHESHHRNT